VDTSSRAGAARAQSGSGKLGLAQCPRVTLATASHAYAASSGVLYDPSHTRRLVWMFQIME
jgi:hypothetical protein